jgi:hypothetical protein
MGEPIEAGALPKRVVLDGVPRVGLYFNVNTYPEWRRRTPEDVPFPSCLRACLEYLGEDFGTKDISAHGSTWQLGLGYTYLMGTSGCAFRLSWRPGWHPDNSAIENMSDDPEAPYRRAFESVGYGYEIVHRQQDRNDQAYFRNRVMESIAARHRPVLAHGVVGPPEECIITGYDDDGDVLIGWSFFQDMAPFNAGVDLESSGMFRKRDWFADTQRLLLIGTKLVDPPKGEVYRQALAWVLEIVGTPLIGGDRHNGLAAYAAWAEELLSDEEFTSNDLEVLRHRFMVHHDAVSTVAEGRWYGAQFLRLVFEEEPGMASDLEQAAVCYESEHDLMWMVWNLTGGPGWSDDQVRRLAEPAVRRDIIPLIHESRDKEEEAAAHVEKALAT